MDDLLRSISWHAEKRFRRHGTFASVLWLTEDAAGRRQLFETGCHAPQSVATDAQVVAALAAEMRADFAKSWRDPVRCCLPRAQGNRDQASRSHCRHEPKTTKRCGVVIELHDSDAGVRLFREIIRPPRGKPVLGAAQTLDEPITASPYFDLLRADADAEA